LSDFELEDDDSEPDIWTGAPSGLRSPYPWQGGKSRAAPAMWEALGPGIVNLVIPFFGSGAELLGRPGGPGKIETVNDLDGAIPNFWRAVVAVPEEVAAWCDWPVSELDLHARHAWLVGRLEEMTEQLRGDPHYYDAKVAGWWVWGICQWIGTGWCGGVKHGKPRPNLNSGQGVHAGSLSPKLPNLSGFEGGVRALGVRDFGLPSIGNDRGINGVSAPPCLEWFRALQVRLRRVRVVCGDWTRVLGPSVLGKGKNVGGRRPCGVILDPPYDTNMRAKRIYNHDAPGLAAAVREWALEHGDDPELRIILCGYFEEHAAHMPDSWRVHRWKGARGYASEDNDNREQETLWFSKHCLSNQPKQGSLFK
jgi:hypothetical protein